MYISKIDDNKTNFGRLKIKVSGKEFKRHPNGAKMVKDAIINNEVISEFFKTHNGKIRVTAGKNMVPIVHDYPACLKKVPSRSLPFDQFTVNTPNYYTNIECSYKRAFALRNLFKKPVHVNGGIKAPDGVAHSWGTYLEYTLRLINEKFGDAICQCEKRRLMVEKP